MISKSTLLHLRIPFSYFLFPVFMFALASSPTLYMSRAIWVFVILHFFLYPSSNGYNSYFDKDTKSIGGLKNPPPVEKNLYFVSLFFEFIGLIFACTEVSVLFGFLLFIYGLASKAYSHPSIRLKKYPIIGWLVTGFFQGGYIFFTSYLALNDIDLHTALKVEVLIPSFLSSLFLWGNYPMTQVYQHEEDKKRGDNTLSLALGIKGTFLFSSIFLVLSVIGFESFLITFYNATIALAFGLSVLPVGIFFGYWIFKVFVDITYSNYSYTIAYNFISATSLNLFFVYLLFFRDSVSFI